MDRDSTAAARAIATELRAHAPRFVLFFVSSHHDVAAFGAELARALGDVPCIGCTTAGELVDDRMLDRAAVAMGLGDDIVADVATAIIDVPTDPRSVEAALRRLADAFGTKPGALTSDRMVGIVLHDGLGGTEERVMETIGAATNVPFVGGSSGDDLAFQRAFVFAGGEAMAHKSVLAMLELRKPYAILKTQSFDVLEQELEVTEADEATRTVISFNGKPAAVAYAEAAAVDVGELPSVFQRHPIGLVTADGEPFVRSPQQIRGHDVVFYCRIKQGMKLRLLKPRDIVADTRRALDEQLRAMGGCAGLVNFHCILRTIELKQKDQTRAYGQVFAGLPTVGFSTYGESYVGHINQTSVMLLFGA